MIFGDTKNFAIEISNPIQIEDSAQTSTFLVCFRFIILNQNIGEWDVWINLFGSSKYMQDFLASKPFRKKYELKDVSSAACFNEVHDRFYQEEWYLSDNTMMTIGQYREWFHLTEVAMGSVEDLYAIVAVDVSQETTRIIVKNFRQEQLTIDYEVPSHIIDGAALDYTKWASDFLHRQGYTPPDRRLKPPKP